MMSGVDKWRPIASISEINVRGTDLLDDAWGISRSFPDVISFLSMAQPEAPVHLIENLLSRIESELKA